MSNGNWRMSDWFQRRLRASKQPLSTHKTKLKFVLLFCVWTVMLLLSLLSGCATKSIEPCVIVPPPLMPALSASIPSESYSIQAQKAIEAWRKRLIDTPATSER